MAWLALTVAYTWNIQWTAVLLLLLNMSKHGKYSMQIQLNIALNSVALLEPNSNFAFNTYQESALETGKLQRFMLS